MSGVDEGWMGVSCGDDTVLVALIPGAVEGMIGLGMIGFVCGVNVMAVGSLRELSQSKSLKSISHLTV